MNKTVWLIRCMGGFGWSDYPAIYGETWTNRNACLEFAKKLAQEQKDKSYSIAVYQCEIIEQFDSRMK